MSLFDRLIPGWVFAAAFAALLALIGVQQLRIERLKTQQAETLRGIADKAAASHVAAIKARDSIRNRESELTHDLAQNAADAAENLHRIERERDDARARGDRLRADLRVYVARARASAAHPAPGANEPSATDPIGVLANLLERADARSERLAAFADAAYAAGRACERDYDAAERAVNAPP